MLKATFNLRDGTLVTLEGTEEAVKNLLDYYSNSSFVISPPLTKSKTKVHIKPSEKNTENSDSSRVSSDTLTRIVHMIKTCPEADAIEKNILGKEKPAEADRVLLPLYIVHEYFENGFALSTNEISTITADLGPKIKVSRQNANRQFVRKKSTSRYVLGNKTRKTGAKMRYTLNDRGVEYMKSILEEVQVEK